VKSGVWSQGRAIRAAAAGASVTIETHCQHMHDIYVGTRLDTTCGIMTGTLDGGAPVTLDCYYPAATTSQTRRLLFSGVAAGQHEIVITLSGNKNASSQGWYFYFDFLECAVASDVPDPVVTTTAVAVATDFDTDNTNKLSPQRLVWNIQKLGLVGEIDHYCGVFWWKQAVASNPSYPQCTVTFSGNWNDQDVVWLHVGGSAIGKTVFGGQDSSPTIARHFANFINAIFDGVWAGLMLAAGLTPKLQFGEILWWFQANAAGMAFYDADTQAAAQSALGRALAPFHTPNDDPSINGYADADFLRTRLFNYVAAIQSYVLSQYSAAVFELLWPMDVNDPDNCKLLRYINLPSQWTARSGSGFDTFLIEGYQYPGINHNLDQATRCASYARKEFAWDQAHCRYLMGLYYGTWPWLREFVNASRLGLPAIKLWAYDHVCLYAWPIPLPTSDDRSFIY
jgi:hypothetical protein